MIHDSLTQLVPCGSDHALQGIQLSEQRTLIRGLTHNTLNQCFDRDHCPLPNQDFNNNPFNCQEDDKQYLARKKRQLQFYVSLIKEAKSNNNDLDFIFLQEIDLFSRPLFNESEQTRQALLSFFYKTLDKLGWSHVITRKEDQTKPLMTLYNRKSLTLETIEPVFIDKSTNKYTGLETNFKHRKSSKPITLTNVHFNYSTPGDELSQALLDYLFDNTSQGYLTVIGGDTNHLASELAGAIAPNTSTCLVETQEGQLSTTLENDTEYCIDHFFIAPSATNLKVNAVTQGGYYFDPQTLTVKVIPNAYNIFQSSPSPGWPVMPTETFNALNQDRHLSGPHYLYQPSDQPPNHVLMPPPGYPYPLLLLNQAYPYRDMYAPLPTYQPAILIRNSTMPGYTSTPIQNNFEENGHKPAFNRP